jgi:hypothetical protein
MTALGSWPFAINFLITSISSLLTPAILPPLDQTQN